MQARKPLLGASALFCAAHPLLAQGAGSSVAPDLGAAAAANSSSSYPWNRKTSDCRVQYIYDASEMPAFPVTITAVRFRPFDGAATTTTWTGGTYGNVVMSMSTAAVAWDKLTTTFATNHGGDLANVFTGSVPLSAGSGTGPGVPSKPYVSIKLTTPFKYDPAKGPLLIDLGTEGAKYTGGTTTTNAVTSGTHKASRMFNLTSYTATTGSVQANVGLVMEFDYTFSGTYPAFSANRTTAPTGSKVDFTDMSVTSATAGILSYSWDLDGNGTFGDSILKNPSFTYTKAGTYGVGLRVISGGGVFTLVKKGLITIADPIASVPDIIQYQYNETRDPVVANSAPGSSAPAQGKVTGTKWQTDSMNKTYGPNEKGFGAMKAAGATNVNWVSSGYNMNISGSMTIAWWQKMDSGAPANAFGYAWGGASGSSFRCFNRGAAGDSITCRGNTIIGTLDAGIGIHTTNWVHLALVIDDKAGTATWFVNGEMGNQNTFTAGTFAESSTDFQVGKYGTSTSTLANYYSIDDFRIYGKALSFGEVLGLMIGENASVGNFGTSCVTTGTAPVISGAGGLPKLGNASFRAELTGAPAGAPYALVLGFVSSAGGSLPLDISPILGTGCVLETQVFLLSLGATNTSGSAVMPLPVPNSINLVGGHVYVQGAFDTAANKGTTDLLDINIQK